MKCKIIGAGLAGCEAAYQLAKRGVQVLLYDAKPAHFSPAHSSKYFAELVCSNSLKSNDLTTASGLLKEELRLMDSLLIKTADKCKVGAGGALAVDREQFSKNISDIILQNPNIKFVSEIVSDFDDTPTIIACGPLILEPLASSFKQKLGNFLAFYDAAAPIVSYESIDMNHTFIQNRYDKGGIDGDYINCPLNKEEYNSFIHELSQAKVATKKEFEKGDVFEGCMPLEIMAARGGESLRFGPFKPVGLRNKDGSRPYAVLQLRKENALGNMYNLVGCQTNLTFGEQKRVFGIIPALKNVEFLRYGVMHKNAFIDAPKVLDAGFSLKAYPNIFVAGQLSGVEGYVESIMSGLIASINMYHKLLNGYTKNQFILPNITMAGALSNYITLPNKNFQPMNANFGLFPHIDIKDKIKRKQAFSDRALEGIKKML
ncbi:MAG: methylenetetrahydrofolate--tRNA-(uracil(54)-C(5))-methyltransferase (FADH(2)-oxidizing) TrmFO [Firmicutes bacterium]|nr:methylenetetrahydrofolate--tRNA-(uracil(54)-C(5))-methyltransferase (FADH(2)-oxidizing) TrmFO [Bacillota bacterium]